MELLLPYCLILLLTTYLYWTYYNIYRLLISICSNENTSSMGPCLGIVLSCLPDALNEAGMWQVP